MWFRKPLLAPRTGANRPRTPQTELEALILVQGPPHNAIVERRRMVGIIDITSINGNPIESPPLNTRVFLRRLFRLVWRVEDSYESPWIKIGRASCRERVSQPS